MNRSIEAPTFVSKRPKNNKEAGFCLKEVRNMPSDAWKMFVSMSGEGRKALEIPPSAPADSVYTGKGRRNVNPPAIPPLATTEMAVENRPEALLEGSKLASKRHKSRMSPQKASKHNHGSRLI